MALTLNAYVSDGSVLLAMDMPQPVKPFAGFSIFCKPSGQPGTYVPNRLSFTHGVSQATTAATRVWTGSDTAPFQKYYWVDFPATDATDSFVYTVTAQYFAAGGGLTAGDSATVSINFGKDFRSAFSRFRAGYTRSYMSSQAYAEQFHNAPFRPAQKSMNFDTTPFEKQYVWLGYTARKMIFDFVAECLANKTLRVDLFAYDLDEPDFIRSILQLAKEKRLRAFCDDAPLHNSPTAIEPNVRQALLAADPKCLVACHFLRFAHDKILIQRDAGGTPLKVLTGSANFSLRGLYVQANNVIIIEDPATALLYGKVFDAAFDDAQSGSSTGKVATDFQANTLAKQWFDVSATSNAALPQYSVCFSPHPDPNVSLQRVDDAIKNAKSSVFFAVMELTGGGNVMQSLATLDTRTDIFAYGVTQNAAGITLFKPGSAQHGEFATFAYLQKQVPAPFQPETSGGMGQVIHNKFVVIDFDGDNPVVFTGSSNLSAGGEQQNGDNMIAIYDKTIATGYAVEAIRLVDHYHFRMLQQQQPSTTPVTLQGPSPTTPAWWQAYYTPGDNKYFERILLARAKPGPAVKSAGAQPPAATRAQAVVAAAKAGKTAARAPKKSATPNPKPAAPVRKSAPAKPKPAAPPRKPAPRKTKPH